MLSGLLECMCATVRAILFYALCVTADLLAAKFVHICITTESHFIIIMLQNVRYFEFRDRLLIWDLFASESCVY